MSNETYLRKTFPYLKRNYLSENYERIIFDEIGVYVDKYNTPPSASVIEMALAEKSNINESELKKSLEFLQGASSLSKENKLEWLIDQTEKFCQEKAVYNAIMESIQILDGQDSGKGKGSIPSLLSDALGVSFDPNIGHDYLDNADERYDFYHRVEKRIPFDLDYFNRITKGGLPSKTLSIALAGTGVGKSLFMCHVAAACLIQNFNVLYITLEMAEEKIAERIDANLLNVTVDDLMMMPKDMFDRRMNRLKEKVKGKLIIKEYPTASANPAHFRALLSELALKKNFKPDIIFVDYLNICASSRIKAGANVNSYTYIKAIAEELRGLAVERNVPIMSATQTTRSGFSNSDPGLEDTSESFGLPATADLMFALISTEELQNLGQLMVKQLKNRHSDPNNHKRFVIGIDRAKMKLFDLESSEQNAIAQEPVTSPSRSDKFSKLRV
jgi:archaellum biogenesis ATPase FlaH